MTRFNLVAIPAVRFLIILLGCTTVSGCAFMQTNGTRQNVVIRSVPPGAEIFVNGEPAGTTPQYLSVQRKHPALIEVDSAAGAERVELEKQYRWRDSFFSNLIFLTYAPVGWVVDLASGAAYERKNPAPVHVRLTREDEIAAKHARNRLIAVAPPQADSAEMSDAGAQALQEAVEQSQQGKLRPYDDTVGIFAEYNYDFDERPGEKDRAKIYSLLGVDAIYESSIVEENGKFVLKSKETNVYTGQDHDSFQLALSTRGVSKTYTRKDWWARLLPNSLGVSFANEDLEFKQGNSTYYSQTVGGDQWWALGLKYLSALDIDNIPLRRPGHAARWQFAFVPAIRLSRMRIRVSGLPLSASGVGEDSEYIRWWISAGYGPEVGYQISRHYIYLNFIPDLYWTNLDWVDSGQAKSVSATSVSYQAETGYVVSIGTHWAARLFSRTVGERNEIWGEALKNRLPTSQALDTHTLIGGLSIVYRLTPKFERVGESAPTRPVSRN
jgi:hypothetical protein